jgi:hypothetical protein
MVVAGVGGDPQLAVRAGTFAPGEIGDPTAAGNTCDDANDDAGCIFTHNLLVPDATPDEIDAAVSAGGATGELRAAEREPRMRRSARMLPVPRLLPPMRRPCFRHRLTTL